MDVASGLATGDFRTANTRTDVDYTHYDFLDLPPGASTARVEAAYQMIKQRFSGSGDEELVRMIHRAYAVLSDAERRAGHRLLAAGGLTHPTILHPGAGAQWKYWSPSRFAELASFLINRCLEVALVEGQDILDLVAAGEHTGRAAAETSSGPPAAVPDVTHFDNAAIVVASAIEEVSGRMARSPLFWALRLLRPTSGGLMNPNKALWEKGDFTQIAGLMRESGEAFVASLGIQPPVRVLTDD